MEQESQERGERVSISWAGQETSPVIRMLKQNQLIYSCVCAKFIFLPLPCHPHLLKLWHLPKLHGMRCYAAQEADACRSTDECKWIGTFIRVIVQMTYCTYPKIYLRCETQGRVNVVSKSQLS